MFLMASEQQIQQLLDQIFALTEEAQNDVVQSLLESRAEHLGIYHFDDDEKATSHMTGSEL